MDIGNAIVSFILCVGSLFVGIEIGKNQENSKEVEKYKAANAKLWEDIKKLNRENYALKAEALKKEEDTSSYVLYD